MECPLLSSDEYVNILCPRPIQEYKNNMAQQEDIQTREERYVALPDVIYHPMIMGGILGPLFGPGSVRGRTWLNVWMVPGVDMECGGMVVRIKLYKNRKDVPVGPLTAILKPTVCSFSIPRGCQLPTFLPSDAPPPPFSPPSSYSFPFLTLGLLRRVT